MTDTCWQARDAEVVVMIGADCTKDEFLEAIATKYGHDWAYGTPEYGPRFIIEPITRRVFDAYISSGWVDQRPS